MAKPSRVAATDAEVLDRVLGIARRVDYEGYSKHDALNAPVLERLAGSSRARRLVATQLVMRSPIDVRPMVGVHKARNPKGIALFARALLARSRLSDSDTDRAEARALLRQNIEALGLGGVTRVFRRDATRLGLAPKAERFQLAFLDPPYGRHLAPPALAELARGGWLTPGALAVVEEAASAAVALPAGFREEETRRYGDTQVVFARWVGAGENGQAPTP